MSMKTLQTAAHIAKRGVYGQNDGSLSRGGKDSATVGMGEYMADSEIAEGKELAVLTRMYREQDWKGFASYTEGLRKGGWAKGRIDSLVTRATVNSRGRAR
jgi:hypothetical protein